MNFDPTSTIKTYFRIAVLLTFTTFVFVLGAIWGAEVITRVRFGNSAGWSFVGAAIFWLSYGISRSNYEHPDQEEDN